MYYYAVGRIRALETRMLSEEKILRLASAENFSAAFAILNESCYADHLPKLIRPFDYEELLALELQATKDLFNRLAPDNKILNALWLKYDFQERKLFLKQEGQMADLDLDRHYYQHLKKIAEKSKVPFFQKLVRFKIDLLNLKIWLRVKVLGKDLDLLKKALLSGGAIDLDLLIDLFQKNPEDLALRLKYSDYGKILAEGIASPIILEKLMDNLLISEYQKAKYFAYGVEPLIGFMLAKEQEIQTVRFILTCKQNFVRTEQIKERLRKSYL